MAGPAFPYDRDDPAMELDDVSLTEASPGYAAEVVNEVPRPTRDRAMERRLSVGPLWLIGLAVGVLAWVAFRVLSGI